MHKYTNCQTYSLQDSCVSVPIFEKSTAL